MKFTFCRKSVFQNPKFVKNQFLKFTFCWKSVFQKPNFIKIRFFLHFCSFLSSLCKTLFLEFLILWHFNFAYWHLQYQFLRIFAIFILFSGWLLESVQLILISKEILVRPKTWKSVTPFCKMPFPNWRSLPPPIHLWLLDGKN